VAIQPNGRIVPIDPIITRHRRITVPPQKDPQNKPELSLDPLKTKVKFEIYGEEMLEKIVKSSGNSGRVYLPPDWVGRKIKIVRID